MGSCRTDELRQRFAELQNDYSRKSLDEICFILNTEYEECFYVRDNELYVDCSDFSQRDVKIS